MREPGEILDSEALWTPHFAGFWWRVLAFLVDGVVIAGISYLCVQNMAAEAAALFALLFFLAYSTGFEGSTLQATPGKMATRLRVADVDGGRLSWERAASRALLKLVSAGSGGAGFAVAAFTPFKQAIHDLMAGTVVIRPPTEE